MGDPPKVKDQFAPAQFFEMSDAEKLSSKSFERYDSGVRITASMLVPGTGSNVVALAI